MPREREFRACLNGRHRGKEGVLTRRTEVGMKTVPLGCRNQGNTRGRAVHKENDRYGGVTQCGFKLRREKRLPVTNAYF